jgi:hypothetical protein
MHLEFGTYFSKGKILSKKCCLLVFSKLVAAAWGERLEVGATVSGKGSLAVLLFLGLLSGSCC